MSFHFVKSFFKLTYTKKMTPLGNFVIKTEVKEEELQRIKQIK